MIVHSDTLDLNEGTGDLTVLKGHLKTAGGQGLGATTNYGIDTPIVTDTEVTGAVAMDMSKGSYHQVTLNGNVSSHGITATNAIAGMRYIVRIINGASAYTCGAAGFATNFKFAGGAYTTTASANAIDQFEFFYDGTNFVEVARSLACA